MKKRVNSGSGTNIFLLVMLSVMLAAGEGRAQDVLFSQTFSAPIYFNPALNGAYDGSFRVSAVYRDQWASMIQDPYRSYTVSGDVKIEFGKQRRTKDYVAAGLLFMADKVNPFDYSTNQFLFSGAYHKFLDMDQESYLSAGIAAGMSQKNFIYEDFSFQDQYNGVDGFTFGTDEDLPRNNHAYLDLGLGVNFSSGLNDRIGYNLGVGFMHINKPNISFYQEEEVPDQSGLITENVLDSRLSAHLSVLLMPNKHINISPGLQYVSQGEHQNIRTGSGLRLLLSDVQQNALHLGVWGNLTHDLDASSLNSVILMTGFEYKRLLFGFSYDLSVSDLGTYQVGQHTFEFSISYIGEYENQGLFCPRF